LDDGIDGPLAAATDTKVSTDTIVQWIRLYEPGVIAFEEEFADGSSWDKVDARSR
jgi:hypothetical protein